MGEFDVDNWIVDVCDVFDDCGCWLVSCGGGGYFCFFFDGLFV